jgi:hypothetical protein
VTALVVWPVWADGLDIGVIRELYEAAAASLMHGAHPGPCDNDDMPGEPCRQHIAVSEDRHKRLERAVARMRAEVAS